MALECVPTSPHIHIPICIHLYTHNNYVHNLYTYKHVSVNTHMHTHRLVLSLAADIVIWPARWYRWVLVEVCQHVLCLTCTHHIPVELLCYINILLRSLLKLGSVHCFSLCKISRGSFSHYMLFNKWYSCTLTTSSGGSSINTECSEDSAHSSGQWNTTYLYLIAGCVGYYLLSHRSGTVAEVLHKLLTNILQWLQCLQ